MLQGRGVFRLADCNLRSQVLTLLLKFKLLRIARQGWTGLPGFDRPARAFHQLLLCQHACLQSSDRRIDPRVLLLSATQEEEKDCGSNDKNRNSRQAADPERAPSFVD